MLEDLLIQAMAIAAVSMTVGKAHAFKWLRDWTSTSKKNGFVPKDWWVGRMVRCPYCMSHWLSFLVVALAPPEGGPLYWAVYAFALVAGASVFGLVICCYLKLLESM